MKDELAEQVKSLKRGAVEIYSVDELTEKLEWNRGRIKIDSNGRTSESWLWSAGDCVNGPDVVHAVADGHRVAASIDAMLNQEK